MDQRVFSYHPGRAGDILEEGADFFKGSELHGRMAKDTTTLPRWWFGIETSLSKEQRSSGTGRKRAKGAFLMGILGGLEKKIFGEKQSKEWFGRGCEKNE